MRINWRLKFPHVNMSSIMSGTGRVVRQTWFRNTMAGLVVVLAGGGAVVYNQILAPKLNDQTVWFTTKTLYPNQPIDVHKDLKPVPMLRQNISQEDIVNLQQLKGFLAARQLAPNVPITKLDVEQSALVPTKGQRLLDVNPKWIAGAPTILRSGDHVDVYIVPKKNPNGLPSNGVTTPTTQSESKNSKQSTSTNATTNTTTNNTSTNTTSSLNVTTTNSTTSLQPSGAVTQGENVQPLISNVAVAFVQNNANNEVVNSNAKTKSPLASTASENPWLARANGSSDPSNLELLLNTEQFNKLYAQILKGNQFLFVYTQNK